MPYKKTNEAFFGDSFNRPYTLAFCTSDGQEYSCTANNLMVEQDLSGSCTLTADVSGIGIEKALTGVSDSSWQIGADVEALVSQVKELRARVHALEGHLAPKNSRAKIRSELKTLAYNREI